MNLKYFYDLTLFNLRCKFLIVIFRHFPNYFENPKLNIYIYLYVHFCTLLYTFFDNIYYIRDNKYHTMYTFCTLFVYFCILLYTFVHFLKFIKNKIL